MQGMQGMQGSQMGMGMQGSQMGMGKGAGMGPGGMAGPGRGSIDERDEEDDADMKEVAGLVKQQAAQLRELSTTISGMWEQQQREVTEQISLLNSAILGATTKAAETAKSARSIEH